MKVRWSPSLLSVLLVLPVSQPAGWHLLKFNRIPANRLSFSAKGLEITVRDSAGPVVRLLPERVVVRRVVVRGEFSGKLQVPVGRQGQQHFDDYVLRLGLIEPGRHRLNAIQREFAPQWIRALERMLPQGCGIGKVYCLDVGNDPAQVGREHLSISSALFWERVVAVPNVSGRFAFNVRLPRPTPTIGIWVGSDGDDSHSTFTVWLKKIELEATPQACVVAPSATIHVELT